MATIRAVFITCSTCQLVQGAAIESALQAADQQHDALMRAVQGARDQISELALAFAEFRRGQRS